MIKFFWFLIISFHSPLKNNLGLSLYKFRVPSEFFVVFVLSWILFTFSSFTKSNDGLLTAVSVRRCSYTSGGINRVMEDIEKLTPYKVGSLPTLFYVPDFITDTDQTSLLNNIYGAPASKWKTLKNRRLQNWGGVVHEKGLLPQALPPWLTNLTYKIYEESGLFPSAINHVLINEYLPNQGIMPHQDGPAYFPVVAILSLGSPVVMDFTPHARLKLDSKDDIDKDSEEGTFAIGKDKWLDDHHPFSILLMPRSLLIFKDKAYSDYLHGIKDCAVHCYNGAVNETEALKHKESNGHLFSSEDAVETAGKEECKNISRTSNRISLTCRFVPKVHKNLFRF
ncbi:hypothetical protein VNO77_33393 [Canavalia gladiata]|uniref:Alpha-ketoglutarate-dependent dioxygenase AlkB-like domain-containing protein n=1 Tax=Canavalia gladiata TaxID=3824 RepID=A0AAN9KCB2_CANGL